MHIIHINLAKGLRGGERQTQLLIQALAHYPVQQTLVCHPRSPLHDLLSSYPVNFHYCQHFIQGLTTTVSADIFHAHETKGAYWALLHYFRTHAPYIITRRVDHVLVQSYKHRQLYGNASALVGISSVITNQLQMFHPHCTVIPDAHHAPSTTAINQDILKQAQGRWIIGHIGTLLDEHKGQYLLLEAVRHHPEWFLVLVGDGPDRCQMEKQAGNNVYFTGQVDDIFPYLASFNIFAFPSRYEGLGSSLLDAMVAGKPIIATRVGGIPDIITHKKNGLLIPANNIDALTQALLRLYTDNHLQTQLAKQAKIDAQSYTPQIMAESYWQLYQRVMI